MEAMAQMARVGALPTGEPVFFAQEGRFDNPGLHVWDGEKHVRYVPADASAKTGLRIEIENAVNRHSAENGSNTPDFLLAEFMIRSLGVFDAITNKREAWYGRSLESVAGNLGVENPNGPAPVPMTDADRTAIARAELDNEFPPEATVTGGDFGDDPPFEATGNGPGSLLRPATAPDTEKPAPPPGTRYKPDGFA